MSDQDTVPGEVAHAEPAASNGDTRSRLPQCPYCGSNNVRLSSKQSRLRLVSRYRCRKCGHHFEVSAGHVSKGHTNHRQAPTGARRFLVVGGALMVLAVVAVAAYFGLRSGDPAGTAPVPEVSKAAATAPESKGDAATTFERAMHFWQAEEYGESFNWFRTAANMGHGDAMYFLAKSYRQGRGTVQNYRFAFEYMKKAAFKGVEKAQFDLAYMYRDGVGTLEDQRNAYAWLNILGARGNEEAALERNRLAGLMAPSDVESGQELSIKLIEELKTSVMSVTEDDMQSTAGMQVPEGFFAGPESAPPPPPAGPPQP